MAARWRVFVAGLAAVLASLAAVPAAALPMGSQGTWMVMVDTTPDSAELAANHAFSPRDALGVAAARWDEKPHAGAPHAHALKRRFDSLTYTRQLHRWNLPDAQANLWFVAMAGSAQAQERTGSEGMGAVSLLADYETTRVYTGAGLRAMRSANLRHDTVYARAGFSFYEVEYEEVQPWLVLEVKRERYRHVTSNTVTPMLRLIHRRYFVELGGNRDGAVLNLMLNF